MNRAQRIWDLPTRLVHVGLIVLFLFSWWSADAGELRWHRWSGYAVLSLVLFRLYWGFVGSTNARFASFVRGPSAFVAYARRLFERPAAASVGHNAMGGRSEEHTSELQSLMRNSYAVFGLKKKK